MGIERSGGRSTGIQDAMCSACEMTVVWMQNQLRQNETQDRILNYAYEVDQNFDTFSYKHRDFGCLIYDIPQFP